MSAPAPPRPAPGTPTEDAEETERRPKRPIPWFTVAGSGIAVLLAGAPVAAIVQGGGWVGYAALVTALVTAVGLALHRFGPVVVALAQSLAVVVLLAVVFASDGVLALLPTGGALTEFGALVTGAGTQINTGTAPVPPSPEILFLVTAAFGVLAVAVYLSAVGAGAPAAAGVPLLAVFAVPAALADDLLPWWAVVCAAAGFGLLLVTRDGARRQATNGTMVVAGAAVVALLVGASAGMVGTSGRFDSGTGSGGSGSAIGLSPFTALRGQLTQSTPSELLRVRGLPQATYLRALTLRDYVPDAGWQATRPDPGVALPGTITAGGGTLPADVLVENVGFRDYWLPVFGSPLEITDISTDRWVYDTRSGTAYTSRPREEGSWRERTDLATPTAAQLRAATGPAAPGPDYLNTQGVDPRVIALAQQIVQGAPTPFDKALALQDFFTGPQSQFRYSLQTAPGGGDDALVEFLTVGKVGYCEQYASAMGVMLRAAGLPARVAVGFTGGVESEDYRSITTSDAHAWVEAWFPDIGWTAFDPTPLTDGRTITPPYVLEAQAENDGNEGDGNEETPGAEEVPVAPEPVEATPPPAVPQAQAPAAEPGFSLPIWPFVVVLVLAALVAAPTLLRARERKRRLAAAAGGGPGAAEAAWAELLAESVDRGTAGKDSDTVRAAARRLVREHGLDQPAQQALRQVVGTVEASWYGGAHPAPGELDTPVRTVREGISAGSALTLRERLVPRSLLRFRRRRNDPDPDDEQ
ncbi:DUF3488 and transglutaminase-like domain-containing protein [Actinomycetes bacterium KLBMP 9759]